MIAVAPTVEGEATAIYLQRLCAPRCEGDTTCERDSYGCRPSLLINDIVAGIEAYAIG